jgi:iron-sulfur cluster assembly protein
MAIVLTPAARDRVQGYLASAPTGSALRFGVRRSGCSGWAYRIEISADAADDDHVFDVAGVPVRVDAASLPMVAGTEIDFVKQGLNEQFVFRNPNVAAECGCGESFTTDADKAA